MKKLIFLIFLICFLTGCNKNQEVSNSLIDEEKDYIYVDLEATILTYSEAWGKLTEKIKDSISEKTKVESHGVVIHENRIYYSFSIFEDNSEKKTGTGNYTVDIYTGGVYHIDLGEWIRLE